MEDDVKYDYSSPDQSTPPVHSEVDIYTSSSQPANNAAVDDVQGSDVED